MFQRKAQGEGKITKTSQSCKKCLTPNSRKKILVLKTTSRLLRRSTTRTELQRQEFWSGIPSLSRFTEEADAEIKCIGVCKLMETLLYEA